MKNSYLFISILILSFGIGCKKDGFTKSEEKEPQKPKFAWNDTSFSIDERVNKLIATMTLEEKISQMLDVCPPIERLGIPEYNWWNEALHGVARNGRATVFPQAIGLGATFRSGFNS
tara:strand:- start:244 stop:594 length:351 start_codon:yes stop_codon:yes gene_type:complete